jgi:uncharacterized protein
VFVLLALNDMSAHQSMMHMGGIIGILCGLSALYTGLAQVMNEAHGRNVWPLCPVK